MIFTVTDIIQLGHTFFIFKILRYFPEKTRSWEGIKIEIKVPNFFGLLQYSIPYST